MERNRSVARKLLFLTVLILTTFFSLFFLFFDPISLLLVKAYAERHMECQIELGSLRKTGQGTWLIKDLNIQFLNESTHKAKLYVKKTTMRSSFFGIFPKVAVSLHLEEPTITMGSFPKIKKRPSSLAFIPLKLFDMQVHLETEGGSVNFLGKTLPFQMDVNFGKKRSGLVSIGNSEESLFITLDQEVRAHFEHFTLDDRDFLDLFPFLSPLSLLKGQVTGNLVLKKEKGERFAEIDLLAENVSLSLHDIESRFKKVLLQGAGKLKHINRSLISAYVQEGVITKAENTLHIKEASFSLLEGLPLSAKLDGTLIAESKEHKVLLTLGKEKEKLVGQALVGSSTLLLTHLEHHIEIEGKTIEASFLNFLETVARNKYSSPNLLFKQGEASFSLLYDLEQEEMTLKHFTISSLSSLHVPSNTLISSEYVFLSNDAFSKTIEIRDFSLIKNQTKWIESLDCSLLFKELSLFSLECKGHLLGFDLNLTSDSVGDEKLAFFLTASPSFEHEEFLPPAYFQSMYLIQGALIEARGNLTRQDYLFSIDADLFINDLQTLHQEMVSLRIEDIDITNKTFAQGFFFADQISIGKLLSPLLSEMGNLKANGVATIEGQIDPETITLQYKTESFSLEGEEFLLTLETLGTCDQKEETTLLGRHQINIETGKHKGFIPILDASFLYKTNNILFTNIGCTLFIEDNLFSFPFIDALCEGLYAAGQMDLEFIDPFQKETKLELSLSTLHGNTEDLNVLFAKLDILPYLRQLPLNAEVGLGEKGGFFSMTTKEDIYQCRSTFYGKAFNGSIHHPDLPFSLTDASLEFSFLSDTDTFTLSNLQSNVNIGPFPFTYTVKFFLEDLTFCKDSSIPIVFDGWIFDRKQDLIRLRGSFLKNKEGFLDLELDNDISHIGNEALDLISMTLDEEANVETFSLTLESNLTTLLPEIKRLGKTRLFSLNDDFYKQMDEIGNIQGCILTKLSYERHLGSLYAELTSETIEAGSTLIDNFLLSLECTKEIFSIKECRLLDLEFSLTALIKNQEINVQFLALTYKNTLDLCLAGVIDTESFLMKGKVLHAHLALCDLISDLGLSTQNSPKIEADIEAKGDFTLALMGKKPYPFECLLQTDLSRVSFGEHSFSDMYGVSLFFSKERGLCLRNMSFHHHANGMSTKDPLHLEKIAWDHTTKEISLERLHFSLDRREALFFTNVLASFYPKLNTQEILAEFDWQKPLKGYLSLDIANPYAAFSLFLEEGVYNNFPFTKLLLEMDPFEAKISCETTVLETPFNLSFVSWDPALKEGQLSFFPKGEEGCVTCSIRKEKGVVFEKIKGTIPGFSIDMEGSSPLKGVIDFDTKKLSKNLAGFLEKSYLDGVFHFEGALETSETISSLKGPMRGQDLTLLGYRIDHMDAELIMDQGNIHFNNIHLEDKAFYASIQSVSILKEQDNHMIVTFSPILFEDLVPSLLKSVVSDEVKPQKSLKIKKLEIENLIGRLGDPNSFRGIGHLRFTNTKKKNQPNFLFSIPFELISRLGLDQAALTPVTGFIDFEVRDGKFVFTKFKDIYSEGRLSKFYLPENSFEPYLDFDGNLHVQVRMKQYNLLLKFTELFTYTIQGTIDKPLISIQRHQK